MRDNEIVEWLTARLKNENYFDPNAFERALQELSDKCGKTVEELKNIVGKDFKWGK